MKNVSRALLLLLAAGLGACSDGALAPKGEQSQNYVMGGGVTADLTQSDTTRFSITVDPSRNMGFYLGAGNTIKFPAGSICDPASSYGADQWDQPCTPVDTSITFNVKAWLDSEGNPRTDFDKHVRFVPSDDPSRWVVIQFTAPSAASSSTASILYCVSASSDCSAESADSTMATYTDPSSGMLMRRIKHFSGYNVFAGFACDPSSSDCMNPGDAVSFNRATTIKPGVLPTLKVSAVKTGYMLAWA